MSHRSSLVTAVLGAVLCAAPATGQLPVIATWYGDKTAAVSLTFDDNHPLQLACALPELNARGINATFFLITGQAYWGSQAGWAPMDWSVARTMADSGHELAGHSMTHDQSSVVEVRQCIDTLRRCVPGKTWWTWAYPAGITTVMNEVKKYAIGARGYSYGQIEPATPADFYNVKTLGLLGTQANITSVLASRGWAVETIHCISPASSPNECSLGDNIAVTALRAHLDSLVARRGQLWIAPFGDVLRYIREREAASVSLISSDADSRVFGLAGNLPDSVYDHPLTLKMALPSGWTSCTVRQGTVTVAVTLRGDTAVFDAVPGKGQITASSGATSAGSLSIARRERPNSTDAGHRCFDVRGRALRAAVDGIAGLVILDTPRGPRAVLDHPAAIRSPRR